MIRIKWCCKTDIDRILAWVSIFLAMGSLCLSVFGSINTRAVIIVILISIVAACIAVTILRTIKQEKTIKSAGKTIIITSGDIFDFCDYIVIPVNRCFDTTVDDDIISSKSLHGMFINNYCKNIEKLDSMINEQLSGIAFVPVEKKSGKNKEYPSGTIVQITQNDKKFILLALTHFNHENVASCEMSDYSQAIEELLSFLNKTCQGYEVSMPLIGGGLSRLRSEPQSILGLLVALIKTHEGSYPKTVKIVLTKEMLETVNLDEIN